MHTVELSVDVDIVDSRCRSGAMAEQIAARLGNVTLQVETSHPSEFYTVAYIHVAAFFSSMAESFLTTTLQNVKFDLVDLFLLLALVYLMLN